MDAFCKEAMKRLPLAESLMTLWAYVFSYQRLQAIWEEHRGRCYESVISFPVMVRLVADALLNYNSGRESFRKGIEKGVLVASVQAAYKKLGNIPRALSEAFLRVVTHALRETFPSWAEWKNPTSLSAFRIVIYDGKAIKKVAKRLKPLRGLPGGMLGGRALVAIDWATGLAVAMRADEDGDANDVKYVKELAPQVAQELPGPRLSVSDCGFCDLEQPRHFTAAEGDHFLFRQHPKLKFHADAAEKSRSGALATGEKYIETWGWIGSEKDARRRRVRRIELLLATGKSVVLFTDLLDADRYPAIDLLWVYRERWEIERLFQKVTEVFGLSHLIGGTPSACIFQFAFCMVLYNTIQVIRGYIAKTQNREPSEVSSEMLFRDVIRQLIAWNEFIPAQTTEEYFAEPPTLPDTQALLEDRLGQVWSSTWLAAPSQPLHRVTLKKRSRSHNSVYRILHGPPPKKKRTNLAKRTKQRGLQQ